MRVLTDFHHSSLLRSIIMLFQDRLGHEVYRPIGLEWFEQGYWAINDQFDTAKQYLSLEQGYMPADGTPALNKTQSIPSNLRDIGFYKCQEPGGYSHLAVTLDFFKKHRFDILIASMPQHIEPFKKLIAQYQPNAKLIFQVGNRWDFSQLKGMNVLASTLPEMTDNDVNVQFYHQEFSLHDFAFSPLIASKRIYSYINILQQSGGWNDFAELERLLKPKGFEFKSYGGQCRDGNITGAPALGRSMRDAMFIFHVKPGGDGFGHIIHNAYATGRPVITRPSDYKHTLASELLVDGTFIDLDKLGREKAAKEILRLKDSVFDLLAMGEKASQRFREVVNYDKEAKDIKQWLKNLI